MRINAEGLNIIKQFEGCRLEAYSDAVGQATIGYGHTAGVQLGQHITQAQADNYLLADVAWAEDAVNKLVNVPLSPNQFSALVSLVFNIGEGAFAGSTLLRKLKAGDYPGAADEFPRWCRGNNAQVLPGLVARRQAEADLFRRGVAAPVAAVVESWRVFSPPEQFQRYIGVGDDTRKALAWVASSLGLTYKEDPLTRKVFVGLPRPAPTSSAPPTPPPPAPPRPVTPAAPAPVVPQIQHSPVSCGQASVAMAIYALTGQNLQDTDIAARYGFRLLDALNGECESHGYRWSDAGNLTPALWSPIQLRTLQGLPVVIGLNGPLFSPSGKGHIVLITQVTGNQVTFADPARGIFRTCSKSDMETCPAHPDGKFVFWADRNVTA